MKKYILVTGGTGFIGSFIVEFLVKNKYNVIVPTRNKKNVNRLTSILNKKNLKLKEGNIANIRFLNSIFSKYCISIVIHLAWQGVRNFERNDISQWRNISIMKSLLTIISKYNIKLFIGFGSQAEYGIHKKIRTEKSETYPNTLYGITKLTAGHLGMFFAKKYNFNYAWLRLFPVFGPKDNPEYLIPYYIITLLKNNSPKITKGEQKLDFIYVKDIPYIVNNIIQYSKSSSFTEIFNLCSGKSIKLKKILLLIREIINTNIYPQFGAIPYREDDGMYIHGSNKKLRNFFPLTKYTPLKVALKETIEWYRNNLYEKI